MADLTVRSTVRNPTMITVGITFAVVLVVAVSMVADEPELLIGLGVAALFVVPVVGNATCSRIDVTPDQIVVRGLVVRRRIDRSRAARLVRATILRSRGPMAETVFVFDRDGNRIGRIYGQNFRHADITRVVEHVGLPTASFLMPVTMRALARKYPGVESWPEAHPVITGVGGVVVLVGIALVVIEVLAP